MLQDPYLFTGTIESNIRLGTPSITARQMCRQRPNRVNLLDFIQALPELSTSRFASGATASQPARNSSSTLPGHWPTIREF